MFERVVFSFAIVAGCLNFSVSPARAQVPGVLIWEYNTSEGVYASIGVPDVDGDGYPDVVAAIYYINPGADLYCVSGATGSPIWESSDCLGTWGNKALSCIGDLNGDGVGDVILGTPGGVYPGRSVIAKDGTTGETIWYNDAPPGWVYSVTAMPDVNGDSVDDVIAGSGTSATAFCFDGVTGNTLWSFEAEYGSACWNVAPIGDVNSSGTADVIVGSEGWAMLDKPGLYCVEGATGDPIWSRVVDGEVMDVFSFNDLNGDGIEEVVAGGWTDSVYCFGGADGQFIWGTNIGNFIQEIARIDDVNGDSIADVLVGSWQSSIYCLDGAAGHVLWSAPVGGDCWSVAAAPDIDGDGIMDAVVGAVNGRRVLCVSGVDGSPVWDYYSGERVYDVSSIDDVNGDGLADVLVGLQDQGNALYHLLCFDGDASVGMEEEEANCQLSIANDQFIRICPNPFTSRTTISYCLHGSRAVNHTVQGRGAEGRLINVSTYQRINLSVYDLSGRLVRTLVGQPFNCPTTQLSSSEGGSASGGNQVVWDGKDGQAEELPAGLYCLKLTCKDFERTAKVILLR